MAETRAIATTRKGLRRHVISTVQKAIRFPRKLTRRQYVADLDVRHRDGHLTQLQTLNACQLELMSSGDATTDIAGCSAPSSRETNREQQQQQQQQQSLQPPEDGRSSSRSPPLPPFWSIRLEAAREAERFDEDELLDSRNVVLERHASTMGYPPNYEQANDVPIGPVDSRLGDEQQQQQQQHVMAKMACRIKRIEKSIKHRVAKHLPRFLVRWLEQLQRHGRRLRRQRKTADVHDGPAQGGHDSELDFESPQRPASWNNHGHARRTSDNSGSNSRSNCDALAPTNHRRPSSIVAHQHPEVATSHAADYHVDHQESQRDHRKHLSCALASTASSTSSLRQKVRPENTDNPTDGLIQANAVKRASFDVAAISAAPRPSKHQLRQRLHLSFSSSSSASSSASSSLMANLNLRPHVSQSASTSRSSAESDKIDIGDSQPALENGLRAGAHLEERQAEAFSNGMERFTRAKLPRSHVIDFARIVQDDLDKHEPESRFVDSDDDEEEGQDVGVDGEDDDDISVSSASVASASEPSPGSDRTFDGDATAVKSFAVTPISLATQNDSTYDDNNSYAQSYRRWPEQRMTTNGHSSSNNSNNNDNNNNNNLALVPRSTTYNGSFVLENESDSATGNTGGAPAYNEAYAWQARSLAHLQHLHAAEEASAAAARQLWHLHQGQHVIAHDPWQAHRPRALPAQLPPPLHPRGRVELDHPQQQQAADENFHHYQQQQLIQRQQQQQQQKQQQQKQQQHQHLTRSKSSYTAYGARGSTQPLAANLDNNNICNRYQHRIHSIPVAENISKRRNSSDLLGGCAIDPRHFAGHHNQRDSSRRLPLLMVNSNELKSPTTAAAMIDAKAMLDQQLIMPATQQPQAYQQQPPQQQHCQPHRQRIVLQASTSELMKCLSDFMRARCPKLAHFQSSQVISWLHNVDRTLLVQGWQEIAFINPANVVFLYMLLRELIHDQIDDESELQCIVMTSLYLSYAYMGNEISYPLQPFLCEQDSHERFWNRTLDIINLLSSKMLRLNADKSFFAEVFSELKYFACTSDKIN